MMVLCAAANLPCPPLIHENDPAAFGYERTSCVGKIKLIHAKLPNYVGYCVRRDGKEVINKLGEITDREAASLRWVPLWKREHVYGPARP